VLELRRLLPLLAAGADVGCRSVDFGFTDRIARIILKLMQVRYIIYFWKTLIETTYILVGTSMEGAAAISFDLPKCSGKKKKLVAHDRWRWRSCWFNNE